MLFMSKNVSGLFCQVEIEMIFSIKVVSSYSQIAKYDLVPSWFLYVYSSTEVRWLNYCVIGP